MSLLMINSLPRRTVAVLSLSTITVCKLMVLLLLLKGGYVHPYIGDNAKRMYLPAAHNIVTNGTFNDNNTIAYSGIAPAYAFFLALTQWIDSGWYLSLTICLQVLFDYCIALLLLFLGNRETSIEVGWLAGAIWLVFPPAVVISTWITAETLFTMLLVLSMFMLIRSMAHERGVGLSLAAGLTLGLTTLVRGTTQLFPVFFFAILYFKDITKRLLKCTLFLIGMCLLVLPWTLRNLYMLDELIPVQVAFGGVFHQGSRSEHFTIEGKKRIFPIQIREAAQEGLVRPTDRKATSFDRWRFNLGLRNYLLRLEEEPWSLFPFLFHKFARLWYGAETGTFYKHLVLGVCSLLVVPVGMLQIWLWRREHLCLSVVLGLLVLYFIALHFIGYPQFRFMFPIYPFLIFSASHQYIKLSKICTTKWCH